MTKSSNFRDGGVSSRCLARVLLIYSFFLCLLCLSPISIGPSSSVLSSRSSVAVNSRHVAALKRGKRERGGEKMGERKAESGENTLRSYRESLWKSFLILVPLGKIKRCIKKILLRPCDRTVVLRSTGIDLIVDLWFDLWELYILYASDTDTEENCELHLPAEFEIQRNDIGWTRYLLILRTPISEWPYMNYSLKRLVI